MVVLAAGGVVLLIRTLVATAGRLGLAQRARALAEPAARLGLMPIESVGVPDDIPPFEVLNTGTDRRVSSVLRGSASGNSVVVFDYTFLDKTRQRFQPLHYSQDLAGTTIACIKGSWLSLPQFVLEPSAMLMLKQAEDQVAKQLGDGLLGSGVKRLMQAAEGLIAAAPGWEYPERPDFAYRVRGSDETAVRSLFTPAVLDYFRDRPGWIVEGRGEWLLITFPPRLPQSSTSIGSPRVTVTVGSTSGYDQGRLPADRLESLVAAATATLDVFRGALGGVRI